MPSGTITLTDNSAYVVTVLDWSTADNSATNQSTVTAIWYARSIGTVNTQGSFSGSITIDGTLTPMTSRSITLVAGGANVEMGRATKVVTHNSNGSKSIVFAVTGGAAGSSWTTTSVPTSPVDYSTVSLTDYVRVPNAPTAAPTLSRISSGTSITVTSATTTALSPAGPTITDYSYRQSTDGTTWGSALSMGTDRTITITGLTSTQRYYYQTRAVNGDGAGAWSATRDILGVPAAPASFRHGFLDSTVTAPTDTTIALDWGGYTSDVGRYQVEYKRTVDATWIDTGYSGTTTAYQVTGLTANTAYDFRVSAINTTLTPNLVSAYSTLSAPTLPSTPTNFRVGYLDATVSPTTNRTVSLDWDDNASGITNFKVEYKEASSGTWLSTTYTGTTSSFKVTGLTFNTEYDFRVAAENTSRGTISLYAEVSDTTLPGGPPVRKDAFTWVDTEVYVCTDDDPETWGLASMYAWTETGWKAVG